MIHHGWSRFANRGYAIVSVDSRGRYAEKWRGTRRPPFTLTALPVAGGPIPRAPSATSAKSLSTAKISRKEPAQSRHGGSKTCSASSSVFLPLIAFVAEGLEILQSVSAAFGDGMNVINLKRISIRLARPALNAAVVVALQYGPSILVAEWWCVMTLSPCLQVISLGI